MDGTILRRIVLGAGVTGLAAAASVAANTRAHAANESVECPRFRSDNVPNRTMMIAETKHRRGPIRNKPDSWRDYFWENVHGRAGS